MVAAQPNFGSTLAALGDICPPRFNASHSILPPCLRGDRREELSSRVHSLLSHEMLNRGLAHADATGRHWRPA